MTEEQKSAAPETPTVLAPHEMEEAMERAAQGIGDDTEPRAKEPEGAEGAAPSADAAPGESRQGGESESGGDAAGDGKPDEKPDPFDAEVDRIAAEIRKRVPEEVRDDPERAAKWMLAETQREISRRFNQIHQLKTEAERLLEEAKAIRGADEPPPEEVPLVQEYDPETGQLVERPMTAAELELFRIRRQEAARSTATALAEVARTKMGYTDDDLAEFAQKNPAAVKEAVALVLDTGLSPEKALRAVGLIGKTPASAERREERRKPEPPPDHLRGSGTRAGHLPQPGRVLTPEETAEQMGF